MQICHTHDLGLVDYLRTWELQNRLAFEIAHGKRPPTLLLLEHPHTYTFGRRAHAENLLWDESKRTEKAVEIHWVDRGGDVTYHGPGQLIGYPVLKLGGQDHVGYVRSLERMLLLVLARLGVTGCLVPGKTGVWVERAELSPAKIAAIGVKVDAQGVTRHGFSLNVCPQMEYFEGIIPCGLTGEAVLALADILSPVPPMKQVKTEVLRAFGETFEYEVCPKELLAWPER